MCYKTTAKIDQSNQQQNHFSRLRRSRDQGHGIAHLKRKKPKDRYSIHKLTNVQFLCSLARGQTDYPLIINQKIILLAQMNHVFKIIGRQVQYMNEYRRLIQDILDNLKHPQDFPCLGTLMSTFASIDFYQQKIWQKLMDCLMVDKYDQQYDQLFGIIISLNKYRQYCIFNSDYVKLSKDPIIPLISIFYRNSLNVLMQFIRYGLYNQKQCQLIMKCLYTQKINEGFFWQTIRDWFNIHIKQQIINKQFQDFFIVKQQTIDRILYDQGMIRPRPLLDQITTIAFALSQNGYLSKRYLQILQRIILYTMDNGQAIYSRFLTIHQEQQKRSNKKHEAGLQSDFSSLNEHMKLNRQQEKQNIKKKLSSSYKTIFINPIDIHNQSIVQVLMILAKYQLFLDQIKKQQKQKQKKQQKQSYFQDKKKVQDQNYNINPHIIRWLWIRLCRTQMKYTIRQLLNINKCSFIFKKQQQVIQQFMISRLMNSLRMLKCSYKDLQQLLFYLPTEKFDKIKPVLINFMNHAHPADIHRVTKLLQNQNWIPFMGYFFLHLPQTINFHQKYYSFQQNCYFLYISLKNQQYWQINITIEYRGQMQQLKQRIKTVTYSRGFKLTMDSYFHKLLEYVDVVDFFQGGN